MKVKCRFFLFVAAIVISTGAAYAQDSRIQRLPYVDGEVVVVRAAPGVGTRIVFDPREKILDIASGFSEGWEFINRDNILYIKPKTVHLTGGAGDTLRPTARRWDTNLMVRTSQRLYDFDLRLITSKGSSGSSNLGGSVYRVEFEYPNEASNAAIARQRMNTKSAPRNYNYNMRVNENSKAIAPMAAYDDGRFTYLQFPNNRDFPTAFLVNAEGKERLVNSHVDKDYLVIHRVAPELVLRLGNQVVGVYNGSYDIDGIPAENGMTVPGMARTIKGGNDVE